MTQSEMLKLIARHGYNVGFGAKKNFATYDRHPVGLALFLLLSVCSPFLFLSWPQTSFPRY